MKQNSRCKITTLAVSADSRLVASGDDHRNVHLWTLTGKELKSFETHNSAVNGICFTPDGQNLITAGENIKIWKLNL